MTDTRLRELERRWKESGSVEDEAAWLMERFRSGELPLSMLEQAAYCEHPAAKRLIKTVEVSSPQDYAQRWAHEWSFGLGRWEKQVVVRAAFAMAHHVAETCTKFRQQLIDAMSDWILCPCDDHIGLLRIVRANREDTELVCIVNSSFTVSAPDSKEAATELSNAVFGLATRLDGIPSDTYPEEFEAQSHLFRQLQTVASQALIPWALGYSDPVRERVEARQPEQTGTS